jgi:hypothetical protein
MSLIGALIKQNWQFDKIEENHKTGSGSSIFIYVCTTKTSFQQLARKRNADAAAPIANNISKETRCK